MDTKIVRMGGFCVAMRATIAIAAPADAMQQNRSAMP